MREINVSEVENEIAKMLIETLKANTYKELDLSGD